MMYLAYAYNGFPGIFSASSRTWFGVFLSLVRAPRMDKPGLPSGREHLDFGEIFLQYSVLFVMVVVFSHFIGLKYSLVLDVQLIKP